MTELKKKTGWTEKNAMKIFHQCLISADDIITSRAKSCGFWYSDSYKKTGEITNEQMEIALILMRRIAMVKLW